VIEIFAVPEGSEAWEGELVEERDHRLLIESTH
jgi:hypothetical protein